MHTTTPTVIEIRAAEGGRDAQGFAAELADAVSAHLQRAGIDWQRTSTNNISVNSVDDTVAGLVGVHRVIRIPPHERNGRRHTSTVTVAVLDDRTDNFSVNDTDLDVGWFSGTGAGGQHRNKNQVCCRLRHTPSGIVVTGTEHRSRHRNLADARRELERRLRQQHTTLSEAALNNQRASMVDTQLVGRQWVWNAQRDQVRDSNGNTTSMRQALSGKFPATPRRQKP